jgi:competence protein ComEC
MGALARRLHALRTSAGALPARALDALVGICAAARENPRHLLLAGLVAGLACGPVSPALAGIAALALAAAVWRLGLGLAVVAAVLAGAVIGQARAQALAHTALGPLIGHAVSVRAVALEPVHVSPFASRSVLARLTTGPGDGETVLVRASHYVHWPGTPLPGGPPTDVSRGATGGRGPGGGAGGVPASGSHADTVGSVLALRGRLARLDPREAFAARRGAHAVLVADQVTSTGARRGGLPGLIDGLRRRAEVALAQGLDPPQAALLRGMVLGQDQALAAPTRAAFQRSGLAHILAASGQNVMLLVALALPLLAALGLGRRARLLGVLALIAIYVPLAGGGPSIQRAGVMGAAGMLAGIVGRPASRCYAVLLAAAVTLARDPGALRDVGWELSFAAVIAILLLAPRTREWLARRRVPAALAEAAAVTFAATLGTAPLLAAYFGRVSLVSLPANLLGAPAIAPVMWLGMLAVAVGPVSLGLAGTLNALCAYPLGYLGWLAHTAAGLPHAAVGIHLGAVAVVGSYAALATLVAVPGLRAPAAAAAVAAVVLLARPGAGQAGPPAGFRMSFLDIGQGDATLIQDGPHAILVDTGPPGDPVLARLARSGVRRLDVLALTHAQADHEGSAPAIMRRYPVGLLVDGGEGTPHDRAHAAIDAEAARRGIRRIAPTAGEVIRDGRLRLRILWPRRPQAESALAAGIDPNEEAMVAELRVGHFRALLTADAESDVTAPLPLEHVDVLKVAHHGSADPGLPDLLTRLRPSVAVIEVGAHNTYGHPTAQALLALRVVPHVYRTDQDGTVRLTVAGGALRVSTTR